MERSNSTTIVLKRIILLAKKNGGFKAKTSLSHRYKIA